MKPKILTDGVFRFYEGRAFNKEAKSCGDEDKMLDYCLRKRGRTQSAAKDLRAKEIL